MKCFKACIQSDYKNVPIIVEDILRYYLEYSPTLSEELVFDIKVIANELLVNAVVHGNECKSNKVVKICAGVSKNKTAFLIVEDQGKGFRYLDKLDFHYKIEDDDCSFKEGGRGIIIVKNLSDGFKFNKTGNKVVVIKKI